MDSAAKGRPVVVGIDGSKHARFALRWAVEEAKLRSAPLEVVCAWHYPYVATGAFAAPSMAPLSRDEVESAANEVVRRAIEKVVGADSGLEVTSVVKAGSASGILVDASRHAQLLVTGARGVGGFTGLLLGSVSRQCALHSHCPVVIVQGSAPPPDDDRDTP